MTRRDDKEVPYPEGEIVGDRYDGNEMNAMYKGAAIGFASALLATLAWNIILSLSVKDSVSDLSRDVGVAFATTNGEIALIKNDVQQLRGEFADVKQDVDKLKEGTHARR